MQDICNIDYLVVINICGGFDEFIICCWLDMFIVLNIFLVECLDMCVCIICEIVLSVIIIGFVICCMFIDVFLFVLYISIVVCGVCFSI